MAEFLVRLRGTADGIVDLAGNEWTIGSTTISSNEVAGPFGNYSIKNTGASYIYKTTTDSKLLFTPSDKWTFSAWIRPLPGDNGNIYAINAFCALLNGGRALGYQRISYRHNGVQSCQPCYISPSIGDGSPPDNILPISDSVLYDGNWHHVALVQIGDNNIKLFFDGVLLNTYHETNNVDWGASVGTGILGELNGNGNTYACGYFDDICLISGEALWVEDFIPPNDYLKLTSYAYLSSNSLYTGASLTNLTTNWSGLTNAEKEALVPSFSNNIPSIQDLASISPFRVLTDDTSLSNVKVTGQPKVQTIEQTSLINTGAVSTVQSINITNTITDTTVKFAITTDLSTYKVYDATQGEWVTSTNIEEDGMSIAQINALTPQILALLDIPNGIAFKQCFIATSENASAELSEISAVVDIDGSWSQSVHGTDYNVAYPNKTTMSVTLKTNGDYIINYPVSSSN